jgi:hypothetical protein
MKSILFKTLFILLPILSYGQATLIDKSQISASGASTNQILKWNGTAWVFANDENSGSISGTGTSGQIAFWNGTSSLTGSNNLFWDITNNRLGIGTTTPSYQLSTTGDIQVNGHRIGMGGGSISTNTVVSSNPHNNLTGGFNVIFGNSNSPNITSASGSVLIGSGAGASLTSGNSNTYIGRDAGGSNQTATTNFGLGTYSLFNHNTGNNNIGIGFDSGRRLIDDSPLTSSSLSIFIGNNTKALNNGNTNQIIIGHAGEGLGSNTTTIGTTNTTQTWLGGSLTLGTRSAPSARLNVVGSDNSTSTNNILFESLNGTDLLSIKNDGTTYLKGNVGIGIASPTSTFDVVGTVEFQNPSTSFDGGVLGTELLTSTGWTTTGWTGTFAGGYTHTTGNTSVLSNTLAATVNKFYEVRYTITGRTAGSITVSFGGQSIAGQTSTNAFGPKATTTGNLQVTPTSDFNGTVVMSVKEITAGTPNIVYKDAGGEITFEQLVSGTNNNFFQGVSAGKYNTVGINNIFQGNLAGGENTSGSNNLFQGANAGEKNTTGSWNVFQGRQTGRSNTTGSYNLFQGPLAGELNTTGDFNIFQGVGAGKNNTSGIANVFQGYNAGLNNLTGNYNVAQGYYPLYLVTTGSSNIAVGNFAAGSLTSGSDNIMQGTTAGFSTTSATGNVFIGRETSYANKVGAYNVSIGYRAGRWVGTGTGTIPDTLLNNSILIGFDARNQAAAQTNQIVIGYEGRGLGSNTTRIGSGSSTNQTHLDGRLTIGNTLYDANVTTRISGLSNTASTYALWVTNSDGGTSTTTAPALVVRNDGNVGIGVKDPNSPLHIVSSNPMRSEGGYRVGSQSTTAPFFFSYTTSRGTPVASGTNLSFYNYSANLDATEGAYSFNGSNYTQAAQSQFFFKLRHSFAPTSGTAGYIMLGLNPTINQTGASGQSVGVLIDPLLTSATDWKSILWNNDTGFGLYGSGAAKNYLAGALGIGTTSPASTSILDITSTTKGILIPRMTLAQRDAITSPATGLQIYNTTSNVFQYYNGSSWGNVGGDGVTNLTFTGSSSPFTLNSSTGTDVTFASGTGISLGVSGSQLTITNSSPDQTVSLTGAGISSVTGTYPNFTITSTEVDGSTTNEIQNLSLSGQSLGISSGTGVTLPVVWVQSGNSGISVSNTAGTFFVSNNAPNVTTNLTFSNNSSPVTLNSSDGTDVTFTAGTNVNFSQAGNNLTINSTEVDGSVSNEGVLGVAVGQPNSSVITSNSSTAVGVELQVSTGLSISESAATNGGTITLTNTGDTNPSDDITGSGTTNFIPIFTGTNSVSFSSIYETGSNVGINSITPTSKLVVRGSGSTNATSALRVNNSLDSTLLFIRNDGAVGFGTSNVNPISGATVTLGSTAGGTLGFRDDGVLVGYLNSSAEGTILRAEGNRDLSILTNSTDRITIKGDGKVGVGTTTPKNNLDVNGSFGRGTMVKTADTAYTVTGNDTYILLTASSAVTVTLPSASSWTRREIMIRSYGEITISSASSNIELNGNVSSSIIGASYTSCTLVSDGTNWVIVSRGY